MRLLSYRVLIPTWLWGVLAPIAIAQSPPIDRVSEWDRMLPTIELRDVHIGYPSPQEQWRKAHNIPVGIGGQSLTRQWETMSRNLQLRSILYLPSELETNSPFTFNADKCTAKQLFDAFVSHFASMCWTQDITSGIIWLIPKGVDYGQLLTNRWAVAKDQYGLPMFSEVLVPMCASVHLGTAGPQGGLFFATFDYPVNLPSGSYTIREILNQCCVCNPMKNFGVFVNPRGTLIQPDNLLPDMGLTSVTPGALAFWQAVVNSEQLQPPDLPTVIDALAAKDEHIRWGARCYIELTSRGTSYDDLVAQAPTVGNGLWAAIGCLNVLKRDPRHFTHVSSIQRMEQSFDPGLFESGDPALAAVVALEMVWHSQDTRGLALIAKRKVTDDQLYGVKSDLYWIMRLSPLVRQKILEYRITWFSLTRDEVLSMHEPNIFGLP